MPSQQTVRLVDPGRRSFTPDENIFQNKNLAHLTHDFSIIVDKKNE
jgi:hypothetical protein